ncbi:MAG: hypothetical protein NTZ17_05870 [Phycisphaerae bacterium]|nr:hypothetical protein [Phycisphaerae bacterium]
MRIVLDTNVLISGIFFRGPPYRILQAWRDDDIFLACALAAKTRIVVSGDKHLLAVSGWAGIQVLRPKAFVDLFL